VEKITIVVGSTRRPKLAAVNEALAQFGPLLAPGAEFEVVGMETPSGVGHTPASRSELMLGARQRAESLVQQSLARQDLAQSASKSSERSQYFVGLEGGLDVIEDPAGRRVLLESWAYVTDGRSGYYGRSGGVEIPDALARSVLEDGVELATAIDAFAGSRGNSRCAGRLGRAVRRIDQSHRGVSRCRRRCVCSLL